MVAPVYLKVTLYVHFQCCLILSNPTVRLAMMLLNTAFQCIWCKRVYDGRIYQYFILKIYFAIEFF